MRRVPLCRPVLDLRSSPMLSPEEFERIQSQTEAMFRSLEQSGAIPRMLEQLDTLNRTLPPAAFEQAAMTAQEAARPLVESGQLAQIQKQADSVFRHLERSGALARLADQSSAMFRGLEASGAIPRIQQQAETYLRNLGTEGVIPSDLGSIEIDDRPDAKTRENLQRAIKQLDRLILVLFVPAGQLAADAAGSQNAKLAFDALAVLIALRAVLAFLSGD